MKKYLINCSFGHYPNGSYKNQSHYALIIQVDENETDLTLHVYDGLVLQGFKMQDKRFMEPGDIHFTAQPI